MNQVERGPLDQKRQQLEMVHYGTEVLDVPSPVSGYEMRQYSEADRASYWRLFANVFATSSHLDNLRTAALPDGFFVIEHTASSDVVASAVAAEYPRTGHKWPGSLQWVMTDPDHAGKGLGTAVVAAATNRLARRGYERVYLSTDDWRLPAISVYLKLGWKPLLFAREMEERWLAVFRNLGRQPAPVEFVTEPRYWRR